MCKNFCWLYGSKQVFRSFDYCLTEAGSCVALAIQTHCIAEWFPAISAGIKVFATTPGFTPFEYLVFHICKLRLKTVVVGIDNMIM